jgi:hypothetical protein
MLMILMMEAQFEAQNTKKIFTKGVGMLRNMLFLVISILIHLDMDIQETRTGWISNPYKAYPIRFIQSISVDNPYYPYPIGAVHLMGLLGSPRNIFKRHICTTSRNGVYW